MSDMVAVKKDVLDVCFKVLIKSKPDTDVVIEVGNAIHKIITNDNCVAYINIGIITDVIEIMIDNNNLIDNYRYIFFEMCNICFNYNKRIKEKNRNYIKFILNGGNKISNIKAYRTLVTSQTFHQLVPNADYYQSDLRFSKRFIESDFPVIGPVSFDSAKKLHDALNADVFVGHPVFEIVQADNVPDIKARHEMLF
jgi:hypothetical protein